MTNNEKRLLAKRCASKKNLLSVDEWLDEIERVIDESSETPYEEED
jgi:hypothetical protein